YDSNILNFLDNFIFRNNKMPLLICLDEVNRVFNTPIQSEFFSSVRSFYNSGAYDPIFAQVRWILSTSSEPTFFIDDINQSPFNIGRQVKLDAFTLMEVEKFAVLYGLTLEHHILTKIMAYIGGRPYLVHLLFDYLVKNPEKYSLVFD